jgi:hypothetical protein
MNLSEMVKKQHKWLMDGEGMRKQTWYLLAALIGLTIFLVVWTVFPQREKITEAGVEKPPNDYDLVVVGAEPEGIAAAVSAKRAGLNVLLLDRREKVGGLYTLGWLNMLDLNYAGMKTREVVNKGFFEEFFNRIERQAAFDIPTVQRVFEEFLQEEKIPVLLKVEKVVPLLEKQRVVGLEYTLNGKKERVYSFAVIDATQDADFAADAGAQFKFGREDLGFKGEIGATTLVFSVKNVNWDRVVSYLEEDDTPYTGANAKSLWGYDVMFKCPTLYPDIQIRGLNGGRQNDGTVLINALQIFHLNPLDAQEKENAIARAKEELPRIIEFMRKNCPGFEKAELVGVAPELYIRESRHLIGEKTLTAEDVFQNNFPEDRIALGSYPIDIQARVKGQTGSALGGINPYGISFGVMVPKGVDGLLIAGRSASYDGVAFGSARTVPVGMAVGQAAGVSVKVAMEHGATFREMAYDLQLVGDVQQLLQNQGVDLTPIEGENPEKESWAFRSIQRLRGRGMLSKGYYNDYQLTQKATKNTFRRMFVLINYNSPLQIDMKVLEPYHSSAEVTGREYLKMFNQITGRNIHSFGEAYEQGVLDEITFRHLPNEDSLLTNEQAYALVDQLVQVLSKEEK